MILNVPNLEQALSALTSAEHIKEAEKALLSWQSQDPNQYCSFLLCTTLNPTIRLSALLVLKQVISQYWKDRGRSATKNGGKILQEPVKEQARTIVLTIALGASEHPLQNDDSIPIEYRSNYRVPSPAQRSAAISSLTQIARYDLPKSNPALVPTLFAHLPSSASALEAVLEVVSEKRLLGNKQFLASVAIQYLNQSFQLAANSQDAATTRSMLNCIRHMLTTSFTIVVEKDPASVDTMLSAILKWPDSSGESKELLWEMVVDFVTNHSKAFGTRYLQSYLQYFWDTALKPIIPDIPGGCIQVESAEAALHTWEKIISTTNLEQILSKRCLIATLEFFSQAASRYDEEGSPAHQIVWNQFFTFARVIHLSDLCCFNLLISCNKENIEEWKGDPEDYFWQVENESEGESIASAAQSLYCSLIESERGKEHITHRLIGVLNHRERQGKAWQDAAEGKITTCCLMWDAIFTAAGLASTILDDSPSFDFNQWYSQTAKAPFLQYCSTLSQTQIARKPPPLLCRRFVWMTGCFSSSLSRASGVFESLLQITMDEKCDLTLRLTTLQSISSILTSFSDGALGSVEAAKPVIEIFYKLAASCEDVNSQNLALEGVTLVLSFIVGMGNSLTSDAANAAITPLPALWDGASGERILLRKHVLSICSQVAAGVGSEQVSALYPIAIPIIDSTLDPSNSNDHSHLVSDALALWLTILRLEQALTAELVNVFKRVKDLLEADFEHLK